jgi:hypothetical protein
MIQNVLRALGGVEIYGILSVCLFFGVFLAALIFAATRKKQFCQSMSALPLEDGNKPGVSTYEESKPNS